MAVREQAGQRLADEVALADDHPADFAFDRLGALGEGLRRDPADRGGVVGRRGVHRILRIDRGRGSAGSVGRVERAEVVPDEVLHGQRDVVAVEGREGVVVEVGEHLLVRRERTVVLALAGLVALLALPVAAGTRRRTRDRRAYRADRTGRRRSRGPLRGRPAGSGCVGPAGGPPALLPLPRWLALDPPPPMAPWPWP